MNATLPRIIAGAQKNFEKILGFVTSTCVDMQIHEMEEGIAAIAARPRPAESVYRAVGPGA